MKHLLPLMLLLSPLSTYANEAIVWRIGRPHINISELSGLLFRGVLDIDFSRAVLVTIIEDDIEKVIGFRYVGEKPSVSPLTKEEIKSLHLERIYPEFEGEVHIGGKTYVPKTTKPKILILNE